MTDHAVVRKTQKWIDDVVVGMGLCPFASASIQSGGLRIELCASPEVAALSRRLIDELVFLQSPEGKPYDSSLLVHPNVLTDFTALNEFLGISEDILARLSLEGEYQVASFHPNYRFSGADEDDVGNYTNRSPYPMLHVLREASVTAAIADYSKYADPAGIPAKNIQRLATLGMAEIQAVLKRCKD